MSSLKFKFDGEGEWEAISRKRDRFGELFWRITVIEDGTFWVGGTDSEVLDTKKTRSKSFKTFDEAHEFCVQAESDFTDDELFVEDND